MLWRVFTFRFHGTAQDFSQFLKDECYQKMGRFYQFKRYCVKAISDTEYQFCVRRIGLACGYWYLPKAEEKDGWLLFRGRIRFMNPATGDRRKRILLQAEQILWSVIFLPLTLVANISQEILALLHRLPFIKWKKTEAELLSDFMVSFLQCQELRGGRVIRKPKKHVVLNQNAVRDAILDIFSYVDWTEQTVYRGDEKYLRLSAVYDYNPRFPLHVTITPSDGIQLALSENAVIFSGEYVDADLRKHIENALDDRIFVSVCYENNLDFGMQYSHKYWVWSLDDAQLMRKYEQFKRLMAKDRPFFLRLCPWLPHGIIETSDWTGQGYSKIYRK